MIPDVVVKTCSRLVNFHHTCSCTFSPREFPCHDEDRYMITQRGEGKSQLRHPKHFPYSNTETGGRYVSRFLGVLNRKLRVHSSYIE
mmetsp:Transcript_16920/g.36677  ORF Transcript_16920/g.36677 Transcript_16920/m.36677 type:complete len:87 (+) Transcript_16920:775-1035(+)